MKLTGMNSSAYFNANLAADMTITFLISLGIFCLASLSNYTLKDQMMIIIGKNVFFFEMFSFCYLIAIISRGSSVYAIKLVKVFFIIGFMTVFILDNAWDDSIKDMKHISLLHACNPFVYFFWVMQSQMML